MVKIRFQLLRCFHKYLLICTRWVSINTLVLTEIILKSRGKNKTKQTSKQKNQNNTQKRTKKREGKTLASLAQVKTPKAEFIETLQHFLLLKCSFKTMILNPLIITMRYKVMISIKESKTEKKNSGLRACYYAYCAEIIQNNFHFTGWWASVV